MFPLPFHRACRYSFDKGFGTEAEDHDHGQNRQRKCAHNGAIVASEGIGQVIYHQRNREEFLFVNHDNRQHIIVPGP